MKKQLGDMIRSAIDMKDMSQKEAAEALNISPQALSSYIRNTRSPDIETLRHIMQFFNMDANVTLQLHTNLKAKMMMDYKEEILIRNFRDLDEEHQNFALFILQNMPKVYEIHSKSDSKLVKNNH